MSHSHAASVRGSRITRPRSSETRTAGGFVTAPAGKPGSVPGFFLRMELADRKQPNFVTLEKVNSDGTVSQYAVYFEV